MEIGLSLGSNLGDRLGNLKEAKRRIAAMPGTCLAAQSAVYATSPVGVREQFAEILFLNAVLIIESSLDPCSLHEELGRIETDMGRERVADRNAPRPIDLDIIFCGSLAVKTGLLTIPHPRWAGRRFVVQPLSDLRPGLVLPGENKTASDLLLTLPAEQKVVFFTADW